MRRAMMFIDYENFEIARRNLYWNNKQQYAPKIDIPKLPNKLIHEYGIDVDLLKTFLFVPRPDNYLIKDVSRERKYSFLTGLENTNYLTVISGRHCARPTNGDYSTIDISNKGTYYVTEKGTDINIATQLLTKAFHNSYDIAIVMSGDTDYLPVYDVLNTFGKLVIVVGVGNQNLSKLKRHTDRQIKLDIDFLNKCISTYKKPSK